MHPMLFLPGFLPGVFLRSGLPTIVAAVSPSDGYSVFKIQTGLQPALYISRFQRAKWRVFYKNDQKIFCAGSADWSLYYSWFWSMKYNHFRVIFERVFINAPTNPDFEGQNVVCFWKSSQIIYNYSRILQIVCEPLSTNPDFKAQNGVCFSKDLLTFLSRGRLSLHIQILKRKMATSFLRYSNNL